MLFKGNIKGIKKKIHIQHFWITACGCRRHTSYQSVVQVVLYNYRYYCTTVSLSYVSDWAENRTPGSLELFHFYWKVPFTGDNCCFVFNEKCAVFKYCNQSSLHLIYTESPNSSTYNAFLRCNCINLLRLIVVSNIFK